VTDGTTSRTANIRYLIVNAPSTYNMLLGRHALDRIGAVASTRHIKMNQIAKIIARYLDAFVWSALDMPSIDPEFLCHRLTMDLQVQPVP